MDALENILLFVPLGIALQAGFARPRARALGALLSVLVLAIGIQLVQLYLPSRTASVSDAVWNTIGMVVGMLAAARVMVLFEAQLSARPGARDNFLLFLVAIWLCYESFPFVPTFDLGALRSHIKALVFAPPFQPGRLLQHGAAALAAIALMHAGWLHRPRQGVFALGMRVLGLEVCVAYGQLRRETLLGIVLGLCGGGLVAQLGVRRAAGLALLLALIMYLFTVLTPYREQLPGAGFTLMPFAYLLRSDSLGGLPPTAYETLAIGMSIWSGLRLSRAPSSTWRVLVFLLLAVLEWMRVAVVGYQGDTTTLVLVLVLVLTSCMTVPKPF